MWKWGRKSTLSLTRGSKSSRSTGHGRRGFWKQHVWGLGFITQKITQKIIQSLFRIQTQTWSQRLCGGTRLRRLTQTLQPSSQILNVPQEHTDLIHLKTMFQLQSVHVALDKLMTESVPPFCVDPTLYRQAMVT